MRWLLWRHDDGMGVSLGDQADHRLASGQGGGGGQGQQRSDEGVAQGVSPRRGLQTGGVRLWLLQALGWPLKLRGLNRSQHCGHPA